jgi:PKD repeat protein
VDRGAAIGLRSVAMSDIGYKRDVGNRKGRARVRIAVVAALAIGFCGAGAPSANALGFLDAAQVSGPTDCAFLAQSRTIVSSADGTTIAAWQRRDNGCVGATRVEAAVRPSGGSFGAPVVLSDPAVEAVDPKLAIDAAGNVVAVWAEGGFIRYSERAPGGSFAPSQTILAAGPLAAAPDVAISAGTVVAAWTRAGITEVATKAAGAGSFGAVTSFVTPTETAKDVDVALNDSGAAVLTWQTTGTVIDTLRAAARPPGGSFTQLAPVFATTADPDNITSPQVEIDPAGRATLLWTYFDFTRNIHVVKTAARGVGGDFGGVENVSDPAVDSGPLGAIDLAVDRDGSAIAVWWALSMRASVRPAGGSFGPAIGPISQPNFEIAAPSVAFDASGRATAVWLRPNGADVSVQAAVLPKGAASFSNVVNAQTVAVNPTNRIDGATPVAVDDQGNAVTMWRRQFDTGFRIESAWLDSVAPQFTGVSIPTAGRVGVPVSVSASAVDRLSAITFAWDFGDGGTAPGGSASHTYRAGGTYTVTVTATDGAGNASTARGTLVVPAVPGSLGGGGLRGPFGFGTADGPQILGLHLSRTSFRAARSGRAVRPAIASLRRWTRVSYTLSAAAQVRFAFERVRIGRRSGSRCVTPTRGNRSHKSCLRYIPMHGLISRKRGRGGDRFTFTGRLNGHRLKVGRYRLVTQARGGGKTGFAKRATFRIR